MNTSITVRRLHPTEVIIAIYVFLALVRAKSYYSRFCSHLRSCHRSKLHPFVCYPIVNYCTATLSVSEFSNILQLGATRQGTGPSLMAGEKPFRPLSESFHLLSVTTCAVRALQLATTHCLCSWVSNVTLVVSDAYSIQILIKLSWTTSHGNPSDSHLSFMARHRP